MEDFFFCQRSLSKHFRLWKPDSFVALILEKQPESSSMRECGCFWYNLPNSTVCHLTLRPQCAHPCYMDYCLNTRKIMISEYQFYIWSPHLILSLLIVLFSSFPAFVNHTIMWQITINSPPLLQFNTLIFFLFSICSS